MHHHRAYLKSFESGEMSTSKTGHHCSRFGSLLYNDQDCTRSLMMTSILSYQITQSSNLAFACEITASRFVGGKLKANFGTLQTHSAQCTAGWHWQIGQIEFSSSCSNNFLFINTSELIKKINRRLADLVRTATAFWTNWFRNGYL